MFDPHGVAAVAAVLMIAKNQNLSEENRNGTAYCLYDDAKEFIPNAMLLVEQATIAIAKSKESL